MTKFERTAFIFLCTVTVLILSFLLWARPAKAEDDFAVYEGMARAFVQEQLGVDMELAGPARFVFMSPAKINHLYYGDSGTNMRDVLATYDSGVIFLRDDFRLPEDSGVLVHEYVHHAYHALGISRECVAMEERVAYTVDAAWVDKTGWGQKIDKLYFFTLSCRPPWHNR